jgi:hypothetical protein
MFIIFWGRKIVRRRLGHVADFCPMCRVPKGFDLTRVGSARHIYYVSVGEGALVGFERTCWDCHTALQAAPEAYAAVAKSRMPLDELIRETFPNLALARSEQMAIEERVRSDPVSLPAEHRLALARQPFALLSPKVEQRFAATHVDKEVAMTVVGVVAFWAFVLPPLVRALPPKLADSAFVVFLLLGVAAVVWQAMGSTRRFMTREILPVLAGALAPLRPSATEIDAVLDELKRQRHKIGTKVRPADLLAQIGTAQGTRTLRTGSAFGMRGVAAGSARSPDHVT